MVKVSGTIGESELSEPHDAAFDNGIKVSAVAGLSGPHDVETAGAGNILVVDSNNDRLVFLNPDLQILKTLL